MTYACINADVLPKYPKIGITVGSLLKSLENEIRKGDETLKTITNFESKYVTYFFSEMLLRLKAVDTMRYQDKALF